MQANQHASEISMNAVVIRTDGTMEDLGTIAYWNRNPLKRIAHNIPRFLATGRRGKITKGF